ncbi:hypothetical protein JL720_12229 [Aureococcus anophagefferens]|nr:hypothetical protein JL720_12229 [Aureococcus anophagefferens]
MKLHAFGFADYDAVAVVDNDFDVDDVESLRPIFDCAAAGHVITTRSAHSAMNGAFTVARLALDCDKGGAKAAPTMLYWLHIPKCGSTFANTVVHALCDGVPANASEANFLGKTPDFIKGRSCPRLAVPVRAGWGRHDDLSAWLLAEVGGADRASRAASALRPRGTT